MEQAAAFETYIKADPYLRAHRGQYAERNAVFLPIVNRMDLSLSQDIFVNIGGRHSGRSGSTSRTSATCSITTGASASESGRTRSSPTPAPTPRDASRTASRGSRAAAM